MMKQLTYVILASVLVLGITTIAETNALYSINASESLLNQTNKVANQILSNAGFAVGDDSDNNTSQIILLSQKLKKCGFSYRELVGQVKNIGNASATSVQVSYTTFDSTGGVLGTDYTYIDADTLNPGQKSTFKIFTSCDNFKGMKNYELSLEWTDSNSEQMYVEDAQITPGQTK